MKKVDQKDDIRMSNDNSKKSETIQNRYLNS